MTSHTEATTDPIIVSSSDVPEGGRHVIAVGPTLQIGLFRSRNKLYAYQNVCPHQGGPVCQGRLVNGVRERLDDQQASLGLEFDNDDPHIVCPWHGVEYRLTTGEHPGMRSLQLTSYAVAETNGQIRVTI